MAHNIYKNLFNEPSPPKAWRALSRLFVSFLQGIKDKGGLYDFAVQCNEETNTTAVIDRNEVVVRVFVKPTKTAKFTELSFTMAGPGEQSLNKPQKGQTVPHDVHKYYFDESVPAQDIVDTFLLAFLAVESLHGKSRARINARFNLDEPSRTCTIDTSTDVGRVLDRIFTGYATIEYGEAAFQIEHTLRLAN